MYNSSIVFFSYSITQRLIYVAELVFQDLLGLTIVFTQNEKAYRNSKLPKIIYHKTPLPKESMISNSGEISPKQLFFIQNQTILFENDIWKVDLLASHITNAKNEIVFEDNNFQIIQTYIKQMEYLKECLAKNERFMNDFSEALNVLKICCDE